MSIKNKICSKEEGIKVVVSSLIGCLAIALGGATLKGFLSSSTEIKIPTENRHTQHLVVNNSDSYRNVTHKDEVAGVKDIEQLVLNSPLEEAWAYYPEYALWEETGIISGEDERHAAFTKIQLIYLERDKRRYIYHFHPMEQSKDELRKLQEIVLKTDAYIRKNLREKYLAGDLVYSIPPKDKDSLEREVHHLLMVGDALPSAEDIAAMVRDSVKFYSQNQKGELKWKICSKLGITELYLSEKGIGFFADKGFREIEQYTLAKGREYTPLPISAGPFPTETDPALNILSICTNIIRDEFIICNFLTYAEFYSQAESTMSEHL